MDALQQCALNYARLCGYAYDCTIARKGRALALRFTFSPYEFRHLSGLHHLEHPRLEANSERILKDILAGKITLATLQESANWAEQNASVQYQDTYRGCSLFVNDVRDYSARQTKFTLLEKKKIHRETRTETLLYRRETYHPE